MKNVIRPAVLGLALVTLSACHEEVQTPVVLVGGDAMGPGDSSTGNDPGAPGDTAGLTFQNLTPPAWPANIYIDVTANITVPTYTLTPDIIYYDFYKNSETSPCRVGNTNPVFTPRSNEGIVTGDSLHIVARAVYQGVEYPGVASESKVVQATTASLVATTQVASIQWIVDTPINAVTPVTASGGTPPYGFMVSPVLPLPLQMDPSTGEIGSGTAGTSSPLTTYTVTITDSATPQASAQATFAAEVVVTATVGNPELFTESLFEMDFDQGTNGRYRTNGGAWQDFDSWNQGCNNGGAYCRWKNGVTWIESPGYGTNAGATRTELVPNELGSGRVLHTWIEQGDQMHSSATYPRTELYNDDYTSEIPFNSEWRVELPMYASGSLDNYGDTIIGFQMHDNGEYSPPLELDVSSGWLRFYLTPELNGQNRYWDIFPLQDDMRFDVVMEIKWGAVADGAYLKMWVNGTLCVDVTDMNIGWPDNPYGVAGWWKFCGHYDWGSRVTGTRNLYCGPQVKFLRKP